MKEVPLCETLTENKKYLAFEKKGYHSKVVGFKILEFFQGISYILKMLKMASQERIPC